MSTSEALKQLPGLDNAPDVYATPDPHHDGDATESSSITPTSPSATGRRGGGSGSDTGHDDDGDDSEDSQTHGVSRRRLYPDRARSKFDAQSRGIETRGVDLSDRVDGKRRGFTTVKATRRRSRRGSGEEVETLEAKIARLKREVEECRLEARAEEEEGQQETEGETKDAIEALSRLMSELDSVPSGMKKKGHARTRSAYHDAPTIPPSSTTSEQQKQQDQQPSDQTTLTNITAFDSRLAAIESALGLSSLDSTTELSALTSPLLPTIALLDHQVATLTSATSLSALEAASTRIHKLKTEAAELSNLQSQQPPQSSTPTSDVDEEDDSSSEAAAEHTIPTTPSATLTSSDLKTLQSLYTLLPTLQSLSPMIPALTSRLRSLRTIHTAASTAHTDLDGIEERQGEMEKELRLWREGLERVEEAVEGAEEQNEVNGKFVKSWVEELEGRVRELKR